MALEGRDYMRPGRGGREPVRGDGWTGVKSFRLGWVLVAINVAVFCAWQTELGRALLSRDFALSREALAAGKLWTLVTASSLHVDLVHLLSTTFMLWLCGRHVEALYGKPSFLILYLLGGLATGLGYLIYPGGLEVSALRRLTWVDPGAFGASGAVWAVITACLWENPRRRWSVRSMDIPILAVVLLFGLADFTGLLRLHAGPLDPTQRWFLLAGVAVGAMHGVAYDRLELPSPGLPVLRRSRKVEVPDMFPPELGRDEPEPAATRVDPDTAARVDDLLARISADGMDSLSSEEKAFLTSASHKYKRPST
jgi:membrane associated rhomboid family serine protease